MLSTTGLVHVASLFGITVIIVTEIKLGKDHCNWLPILATLIGYILPQPQFTTPPKKRVLTSSMLHLDPAFIQARGAPTKDVPDSEEVVAVVENSTKKSHRALLVESLPSIALLTTVTVWAAISLTSNNNVLQGGATQAPLATTHQTLGSNRTKPNPVAIHNHHERFGTSSSVCSYLRNTAEENGMCNKRLQQTVEITNGTLGMCYVKNKEIGAKLELHNNNNTFRAGYMGWRLLLFRMSRISDRLSKSMCYQMSIGHNNETAVSCNKRVVITGYPDQTVLTEQQWGDLVFYIPDVLLAMLHCRPYTDAAT
jgi:hypothetical protein